MKLSSLRKHGMYNALAFLESLGGLRHIYSKLKNSAEILYPSYCFLA